MTFAWTGWRMWWKCAARALDIIMCTPTASPPIWLAREQPDTLPLEATGLKDFGGRHHYSPTSPEFRVATKRIVSAMAEHFGGHSSIIGWQVDNEYSGNFSQNEHTHAAFRAWLQAKYGSIEGLNTAWGSQFWTNYYTEFEQIRLPGKREHSYTNPHQHTDASRFWSDAWADFNKFQCDILRPHIGERFLTTNFMPFHPDADPGAMRKDLSLFSWDSYPVTGWNVPTPKPCETDETFRLADPDTIAIIHRQMAAYNGRWALMELQPGQVNWSGVPVMPYPGALRLWVWTALAMGAEFVTTYRWRQPLWGIELFHAGLVTADGVTLSPAGEDFATVAQELSQIDVAGLPKAGDELRPETTVGLVLDWDQLHYLKVMPQAGKWDQPQLLTRFYAAAARLGLDVKILLPGDAWSSSLKLVMAPGLQMMDDELHGQLTRYASGGGHLLLGCRTALMNRDGHLFEAPWGSRVAGLTGVDVEGYDGLPQNAPGHVDFGEKAYPWHVWGDRLRPRAGTRVLAKYSDQFYAGTAAITQTTVGSGVVTTCGVYPEQSLLDALVEQLVSEAGLRCEVMPNRVRLARRGKYTFALNYDDKPHPAPAAKGVTFVLGGETLPAAGVAAWIP